MLTNIKAAIFDLDGTLIDSMWIWDQIDTAYLSSRGFDQPKNLKDDINHLSFQETGVYFKNRFHLDDSIETILATWHDMAFSHYSNDVTLKKGVIPFLDYLKHSGIKIGLATSNHTSLLEAALNCTGIYKYFDSITTTDEVSKGKNNPDVYLLAADKLGVTPKECIVFEDILEAVRGAKLANMKVVAMHDESSKYQRDDLMCIADKYIYDFTEML
ncbi:HAD family hydrolase [Clostridium vincentii]|uniref:2-deoxyglucose-6-phosphate phosphatase n=1 Tax=Clostridium vincentii TaxID=52704 RepID=A0A2T0BK57_9CLOT|nr:HAD family phosphatase [Clostridium vincentii]PRR84261.1 2-deoxyglucose-6-phosphate phosphatase [Clostridium vincentii]